MGTYAYLLYSGLLCSPIPESKAHGRALAMKGWPHSVGHTPEHPEGSADPTDHQRELEPKVTKHSAANNTGGDSDALECHVFVHALQTFRMKDRSFQRGTGKTSFRRSCRALGTAQPMVLKPGQRKTQTQMVYSLACLSPLGMTSPDPGCAHPTSAVYHRRDNSARISWQHHRGHE